MGNEKEGRETAQNSRIPVVYLRPLPDEYYLVLD